jgi:hypothetical protein
MYAVVAGADFLDLRGKWSELLYLFPLALALAGYSMLANWFRDEGWFRPGLRSHLVRSVPMYLIAISLLWMLYPHGDTLEDGALLVILPCIVALAAIASDIIACLRSLTIDSSAA